MPVSEQDARVPGGVYLCQVADHLSCGSCCGLYNVPDLSRDTLRTMLEERTRSFASVPRTIADLDAFAQERLAMEGTNYPDPTLHHCPYVGLIAEPRERVGCLLHPLAAGNNGLDWRGLSYYGSAACALFFCPAYTALPGRWKKIIRQSVDDWYSYGLIIVEHRFLSAILGELEARWGQALAGCNLDLQSRTALAELLEFKINWPFRSPDKPLVKNFFSITDNPRSECKIPGVSNRLAMALGELDTDPCLTRNGLEYLDLALDKTVSIFKTTKANRL